VKTKVVSAQSYYPYGAPFNEFVRTASIAQPFKYQGKEWQTDNGLNIYDNEWRQYDPYIVRTTTLDPHAERYPSMSTYSWVFGNPMSVVDPDGRDGVLHLQVLTDENGNVSDEVKKMVTNAVKRLMNDFVENGIEARIEISYSNEIMSKEEFKNRDGAHSADTYTLIGTTEQLESATKIASERGWEDLSKGDPISSLEGTSGYERDGFSIVNLDNIVDKDGKVRNGSLGLMSQKYRSPSEKLFNVIRHETTHDKIPFDVAPRHSNDPGNFMFEFSMPNQKYDQKRLEHLIRIHNSGIRLPYKFPEIIRD
jgi:RHS repeat-associated protein